MKIYRSIIILVFYFSGFPQPAAAYSVLTHEAIIDVAWDKVIQPLLLVKYPGSTQAQLEEAHSYAYGGAVMPDMGYYPFGSVFFTNLTHYVRTGDFVIALLDESQNLDEYAFALGALAHYYADKYGHPIATNHCVPLVYKDDKEKFGTIVTYEQDPISHIRTEFGFDILQTANGNYSNTKYHEFIGFQVARPVLERAFLKTYRLDINDIFKDLPLTISTFRWIIKDLFPTITRAAWSSKKKEIVKSNPGMTKRKFEFKMRNANYYHKYGKKHHSPGFFPAMLGLVIQVLPKVGPLKDLKIIVPGPDAELFFIQSFDTVQVHYTAALKTLAAKKINLPDIDFDTGKETMPGEYALADRSYIELLLKLKGDNFKNVNADLQLNIMKYYESCNENIAAVAGADNWKQMNSGLDSLRTIHQLVK